MLLLRLRRLILHAGPEVLTSARAEFVFYLGSWETMVLSQIYKMFQRIYAH